MTTGAEGISRGKQPKDMSHLGGYSHAIGEKDLKQPAPFDRFSPSVEEKDLEPIKMKLLREAVTARKKPAVEPEILYAEIEKKSPCTLQGLDARGRNYLFRAIRYNRVARLESLPRYDPDGELGFCFGRAMGTHLIARHMGLAPDAIGKMFIIGDLKSGDVTEWRFHVTTVVTGEDGVLYAIDPIMSGPLSAREWIERVREIWDRKGEAKVYLTPASAILPDVRVFPDPKNEKGENIIELSFDPTGKPGFSKVPSLGSRTYRLSASATIRYFIDAKEEPKDRFDFSGISINGKRYDYNNYFLDLLADIRSAPREIFLPARVEAAALAAGVARDLSRKSLYSPKWGLR